MSEGFSRDWRPGGSRSEGALPEGTRAMRIFAERRKRMDSEGTDRGGWGTAPGPRGAAAGKGKSCPYQDLHVYVVEGIVAEQEEVRLGEAFLGNWVEETWSFLFFSGPSETLVRKLPRMGSELRLLDAHVFTYEQWQGGGFEASRIGEFLIVPPWLDIEPGQGERKIVLDPGVVFGNGLHPTTRHCLAAITHARGLWGFEEVLDLGTGTGILAIAAALSGARRVVAVDINPLCVKTARKNVRWNGLEGIVEVMEGRAGETSHPNADLVLANLPHSAVVSVLEGQGPWGVNAPGFILSGLMRSEARDIRQRLSDQGLRLEKEWDHEMTWYTLLAKGGD